MSLVASLALAGSAVAASPVKNITSPSCGQVLSQPNTTYVLKVDIGPCTTDGVIINNGGKGSDKKVLTLDLNGHTIKGVPLVPDGPDANTLPDGGFGEGAGVRVIGSNWVVVTSSKSGATVKDFDAGVLLQPLITPTVERKTTFSKVEKLNVTKNAGNVPEQGGTEDELTDFSDGIVLVNADKNIVTDNKATVNGSGGIRLEDAQFNLIKSNTTDSNGGNGIRFITGGTANLVTGNTSTNNGSSGVAFSFTSPENAVVANVLKSNNGNGVSTSFESDRTLIDRNTIAYNRGGGINLGSGENRVTRNTLTNNGLGTTGKARGNGISLGSGTDNFPRVGTTVSGNKVTGSGGNGIRINCISDQDPENFAIYGCTPWDTHNKILNNVATGNARNGVSNPGCPSSGVVTDPMTQVPCVFVPSGTKVSQGVQVVGWFDLLDSTNTDATLTPFDPASSPFVDDPDVPYSGPPLTNCGNNTWSGNTFNTAYPDCTKG